MNDRWLWLWTLSPVGVGIVILFVLAEFNVIEFHFLIRDVPTFVLFVAMLTTVMLGSMMISREGLRRIQVNSDRQAQQVFAEERARFLQRLDHEIKNPLMGIQTALDNLAETTDADKRHYISSAIQEQIVRLTRIVIDLRKIGELDTREIDHALIDLNMLLEEIASIGSDEAVATNRIIDVQIPPDLPTVSGDYDLLFLSIYNVVNNAVKYTHPGDRIILRARFDDDYMVIGVQDNGPGIPADNLPYVWDELYRAENARGTPGSGIGLALVRRCITRHGGDVAIESCQGEGTTVWLRLPVVTELRE
jgi:two-component system OmpR family sensor kinase